MQDGGSSSTREIATPSGMMGTHCFRRFSSSSIDRAIFANFRRTRQKLLYGIFLSFFLLEVTSVVRAILQFSVDRRSGKCRLEKRRLRPNESTAKEKKRGKTW